MILFGKGKTSPTIQLEQVKELQNEVANLMKENADLRDTINNMTFNDNSELFSVSTKSDNFYGRITVREVCQLLPNIVGLDDKKINFAYEVVE